MLLLSVERRNEAIHSANSYQADKTCTNFKNCIALIWGWWQYKRGGEWYLKKIKSLEKNGQVLDSRPLYASRNLP